MGRWWQAWPGFCATFVAVGIGRFAYTPLIPVLIGAGILSDAEAAYLGAANLLGYLVGAGLAARIGERLGMATAIRAAFVASALSLAACIPQLGFWWFLPWRILTGAAASVLMVLAPSLMLIETAADERARAGGLVYTGVGLGTAVGSLLVAPLAASGPAPVWAALAVVAMLAAALSWRRWARPAERLAPRRGQGGGWVPMTLPVLSIFGAFAADGGGFVAHTIFWVDFIARELGSGASTGAFYWLLFGVGALCGPAVAGILGDRIGVGAALIMVFAVKTVAVAMPLLSVAPPALAFSSLVVGAFSPGIATLCSARISELVDPALQARCWAVATLVFSLAQAAGGYGMSYALTGLGTYLPLFAVGAVIEAVGWGFCLVAMWTGGRR